MSATVRRRYRSVAASWVRRLVAPTAISSAVVFAQVLAPAPASATPYYAIYTNQTQSFASWFFGRTTVCLFNPGADTWGYEYASGFWFQFGTLGPHATACTTRSFVGLNVAVSVWNENPGGLVSSQLYVYRPIGP